MSGSLDFFYYFGSTYTYLSVMRIEQFEASTGITVKWRPFHVGAVLTEHPFLGKDAKTRYMWRDIERRAARHGLDWNGIPPYPIDRSTLPGRIAVLAEADGWGADFTKAAYRAWFLQHQDIWEPAILHDLLQDLGQNAAAIIAGADAQDARQAFIANTEMAKQAGVIGAPSFVWNGEVFWGDDRMEEAFEWAQSHGAMPTQDPLLLGSTGRQGDLRMPAA
ncbi:2-hydroxychromene-2-carboxylate isomerase [Noviherbaspirillum galbum]|uniref:2-hydroxychromene-2-carboxylate isomerase n=1 Tax=Noviherbaspirillum galbum TaxID=2709383 RepID=A0A6B3SNN5_9BURK|nr:DsbA family protein [Noviherbaspirillum galbum]NEX62108.1 2-hydroxychromene-2-carboxylate isomerase [Noviherbaspirillum galbum]